jgi:hypothetical protein
VDLAGLAVAANDGGITLAGALRRAPGALPDYVGMVQIGFDVFAISAYGGYSVVTDARGDFTSLFLFGALNAPLGGPPAFFVTGLGAGIGVNRQLLLPASLNDFPSYPLLQAFDGAADPDVALAAMRAFFPSARGVFWFAAGVSFTSFALVDGVAVLGVTIGDGLDVDLLGLARAALPRPQLPLAQIELALLARFSTKDGVLWVQAQLTDNSFLLTRDCRLTGGFAYVIWFAGDKSGEFVLTLGGYHPSFHRDGYPVVPRLGFVWDLDRVLVIKGECYFALTSDAIMAGVRLEASLTLGPLWAYMRVGGDGIVYFDPFHFQVNAFAELGAGVTIDIDLGWFGHIRITITVSLGAEVLLEGPAFRGQATIDLYVTSVTISFGDWSDGTTPALAWDAFEAKYLRPGGAAMLTVVPGRGTQPPSTDGSRKAPTGEDGDPFLVLPEFALTVTSTAASSVLDAGGDVAPPHVVILAIGPMQLASVTSTLSVSVMSTDGVEHAQDLAPAPLNGRYPRGVWAVESQSEPKPVPTGETVDALSGVRLTSSASISVGTVPIDYHQVSFGHRHQLPFLSERAVHSDRAGDVADAAHLAGAQPGLPDAVIAKARTWLTSGVHGAALTPLAAAAYRGNLAAPPQLVPLRYRMEAAPGGRVDVPIAVVPPVRPPPDTLAHSPSVHAVLAVAHPPGEQPTARTTVGAAAANVQRIAPSRLADVRASLDPRLPLRLVRAAPTAGVAADTLVAAGRVPRTARAGAGTEIRRTAGQPPWRTDRLDALTAAIVADGAAGEIHVLTMPNGERDVQADRPSLAVDGELPMRVVAFDTVGNATLDVVLRNDAAALPPHTDRIVLVGGASGARGAPGWHAGMLLAQAGARSFVGASCTLTSARATGRATTARARVSSGFVVAADVVRGYAIVTTCLPADLGAVAVVLESARASDNPQGDALDLGLAGAQRVAGPTGDPLPPTIVVAGSRTIQVYAIAPDGDGAPIEVTVAAGEHFHLGGIVGGRNSAAALADALGKRDVVAVLGTLVDTAQGKATVRWIAQHAAAPPSVLGPEEG